MFSVIYWLNDHGLIRKDTRQPRVDILLPTVMSVPWSPKIWASNHIEEKWNHDLCVSLFSLHFSFLFWLSPTAPPITSFATLAALCIHPSPSQSLPWLNVSPLFTLYVSVSRCRPGSTIVISMWFLSAGCQGRVLWLIVAQHLLSAIWHVQKNWTSVSQAHTHPHTQWMDVY